MLDGPMIDCLEELNRRSWASISEVFAVLDLTESNRQAAQLIADIEQDSIVKDLREDVYAVFVQT